MNKTIRHSVSLARFLRLDNATGRITSMEQARRFYVDYHAMLCEAGVYSCAGILASAARFIARAERTSMLRGGTRVVFIDGPSASGAGTVTELGLQPVVDIRPQALFSFCDTRSRAALVTRLALAVHAPQRFFAVLFDAYAEVAGRVIAETATTEIMAANERSIGCAPALAAAKFRHGCRVVVVQHGNPVADYLPTLADEYWCRSDRWHNYLQSNALVDSVRRIQDFGALRGIEYAPDSGKVVLVLHSMVHLEPDVDYPALVERIRELCERAGRTLYVMPHPANNRTYGLPVVDRTAPFGAAVGVGFRSTATDQLPDGMRRVSLLDYWPDFFLRQGREDQLEDFLRRVEEAVK